MNAYAQAKHIFWKEYRTQRSLWLLVVAVFLVGIVLIQAIRPSSRIISSADFFTAGILTVAFYLLASTSILFASEKEQETDRWLRVLPTNPWIVLGVKSGWVILSSLLSLLIFYVAANVLGTQPQNAMGVDSFWAWATMFAVIFTTTLISSQLSRNVLSAIGFTILALILIVYSEVTLDDYFFPRYLREHENAGGLLFGTIALLLAFASLELNRRWFRDSDFTWRWGFRLTRAKTLAIALEEAPYSSTWRRLAWKEWQSARIWLAALAVLSLFFAYLIHIGSGPYDAEQRFISFAVNMCLIPLLAGFASCRGDQSQDRYRFLGNRGVSASQTLWTKHAVWMGGCCLILLFSSLFIWTSRNHILSHRQMDFAGSLYLIPISTGLLPSNMVERLSSSLIPAIQFWACFFLLFYALGHWFSISLKQPVLGLMVSFFSALLVGGLVIFYYALGVPLFILTVVPSVVLFSISFIWGEDWLADRRARRDLMRPFWYGVLGLWTAITLLVGWRVMEIPWSTTIDTIGLYNLPFVYGVLCFFGLLLIAVCLFVSDWFRSNLRASGGKPIFVPRRDFRLGKLVTAFLVLHNLGCFAIVQGHQAIQSWQWNQNGEVVVTDIYRLDDEAKAEDLYTVAEDTIESRIPIADQLAKGLRPTGYMFASLTWDSWEDVTPEQRTWCRENRETLELFWGADDAGVLHSNYLDYSPFGIPHPAGYDSRVLNLTHSFYERHLKVLHLVRLEALRLEDEGQLEEAWKHHIAVVRYARRFAHRNFASTRWTVLNWLNQVMLNHDIWRWMAREEQTPELLAKAFQQLIREVQLYPSLEDAVIRESTWALSLIDNIPLWALVMEENLGAGMPWEKQRVQAMLFEQARLAKNLARQIGNNRVRSSVIPNGPQGAKATYTFEQYHHGALFGQPLLPKIELRSAVGQQKLLMSVITSASRAAPSEQKSEFDWYRSGPPSKQESSLFEVKVPHFSTITQMSNDHLAEVVANELKFWQTYRIFLSNFAIYSYRTETGEFPGALYQLKQTKTDELLAPILPDVARTTLETEPDQLSWIANILGSDASLQSYKADYQWYHDYKWPQPEYNFGETPDRKPITPLIAPKFQMDQPIGDDTEMREGYTFDTPEPQETQP